MSDRPGAIQVPPVKTPLPTAATPTPTPPTPTATQTPSPQGAEARTGGPHEEHRRREGRSDSKGLEAALRFIAFTTFVGLVAFCWLVGVSWFVGYACWLTGHNACAERVARPVRFLLQNPPSAGLATIILVALAALVFFLPIWDFAHNLETGPLGLRRRSRVGERSLRTRQDH